MRAGSVLWLALQEGPAPRAWHRVDPRSAERYAPLFRSMLEQGVWMAPSAFEVAFLSLAHTDAEVDLVTAAFERALSAAGAIAP